MSPSASAAHSQASRTGVLLVNLGTPEAPTPAAVRRYLRVFLWDRRVVEIPRWLWWWVLHLIILPLRSKKSAEKYARIWTRDGSPLMHHSVQQLKLLRGWLGLQGGAQPVVELAMSYGQPSIQAAWDKLKAAHCSRVLVLPLYPQYASSTTGSVLEQVMTVLGQERVVPEVRTVRQFHDDPRYIQAVVERIEHYWQREGRPDKLLISFHGLPAQSLTQGDPYHCQCHKTARLITERLGVPQDMVAVGFQSRFGPARWLQPYSSDILQQWVQAGQRRVHVVCPGFVSDCLETLEEIALDYAAQFKAAGGESCALIPCLNDSPAWIEALGHLVQQHSQGWPEPETSAQLQTRQQRAQALQNQGPKA